MTSFLSGTGRPDIALIVATRDRPQLLERCLLPGLKEAAARGFEIVVVDQSEGTDTRQLVDAVPGLRYLRSPPGLSRARNAGVRATSASLVAFTDDDVSIPRGWLDASSQAFALHPDAGAICGRAVTQQGDELPGARSGVYRWPSSPFGLGSGFNMTLRRAALDAVGPFDEELGSGTPLKAADDTDMLYRILRAGWAVVCRDDITVVHHDWLSRSQKLRRHFEYGLGAGAQTAKHVAAGDRAAVRIALLEGARHVLTLARGVVTLKPRLVLLQLAFLAGLVEGSRRRRERKVATAA